MGPRDVHLIKSAIKINRGEPRIIAAVLKRMSKDLFCQLKVKAEGLSGCERHISGSAALEEHSCVDILSYPPGL